MASTAISTISAAIVRRGHPIAKWEALAAGTYIPGDWGYFSATGTVTAIDSGTTILDKPVLIGFPPRVTSTKARKDIDDAIATQQAPIIMGGWTGPLLIAATMENPAATLYKGHLFMVSNTAGDVEKLDDGVDPTGGCCLPGVLFLWSDTVTGDTVGKFIYY
jgi:hypothetical protein